MNFQKFTQKSVQAVNDLEKTALEYGNQEIEQEHLLYSLLMQEESLIARLVAKMEIDLTLFKERVEEALNRRVKVSDQRHIHPVLILNPSRRGCCLKSFCGSDAACNNLHTHPSFHALRLLKRCNIFII